MSEQRAGIGYDTHRYERRADARARRRRASRRAGPAGLLGLRRARARGDRRGARRGGLGDIGRHFPDTDPQLRERREARRRRARASAPRSCGGCRSRCRHAARSSERLRPPLAALEHGDLLDAFLPQRLDGAVVGESHRARARGHAEEDMRLPAWTHSPTGRGTARRRAFAARRSIPRSRSCWLQSLPSPARSSSSTARREPVSPSPKKFGARARRRPAPPPEQHTRDPSRRDWPDSRHGARSPRGGQAVGDEMHWRRSNGRELARGRARSQARDPHIG